MGPPPLALALNGALRQNDEATRSRQETEAMQLTAGTTVLVTGAASGIGRAAALAGAGRGLRLVITDLDADGLAETRRLAAEAGGEVLLARALDVTDVDAVSAFAAETQASCGAVDVVLNIAGVALFGLIEDMRHADWKRVIDVNLWGSIHVIECFLPAMIAARRGHLVNVASAAGLLGLPWHAAYSTSKFAVVGLSEVLRLDLRQHGIGVTVVCPGAVDTPMKHSGIILGTDPQQPELLALRRRFDAAAVSPQAVAAVIYRAIETNRFLAFTSWDVRLAYALKRLARPLYDAGMARVSAMINRLR